MVDAVENRPRVLEAQQKWPGATLFLGRQQMMPARHRPRALAKPLESEHFSADRPDELFTGTVA